MWERITIRDMNGYCIAYMIGSHTIYEQTHC